MLQLLTPTQMAAADAGSGVPGPVLMERAGWAVARAALRFGPCRTLVLCGPGNNGGDGYIAARLLAGWGWPVRLAALAPPRAGSDAAGAAALWHGPAGAFTPAEAARAELVIDAVFGAGLARALDDAVADTLAAAPRILAVDVPSGVDGANGAALGRVAQATLTVTFFRRKPGHLLLPGRDLCGDLVLADIGIPPALAASDTLANETWANGPGLWRLPSPGAAAHKYTRGVVTVLGGAEMTGAAQLAAAAARHGGAGMVTVAAFGRADVYRAGAPGLIVSEAPLTVLLQDQRRTTWVCGPGLGHDAARAALPLLLAAGRQVAADADALAAHTPEQLRGVAVLTPHEGEFTHLFGPVGPDRLAATRAAARRVGAVLLLKGSDTVIAAPDGRAAINTTGSPALATGGSGDVLSGLIAALLSGGMPPWDAACAGAWLHGRAGQDLGAGLVAEDLPAAIARVMRTVP